jgi:hypothetical protein
MPFLCRVYWLDPVTGELELQVAKTLQMEKAAEHPEGLSGWEADVFRELAALECVCGVPGVVQLRQLVKEPNGAVHIILQSAPLCSTPLCLDIHIQV